MEWLSRKRYGFRVGIVLVVDSIHYSSAAPIHILTLALALLVSIYSMQPLLF